MKYDTPSGTKATEEEASLGGCGYKHQVHSDTVLLRQSWSVAPVKLAVHSATDHPENSSTEHSPVAVALWT